MDLPLVTVITLIYNTKPDYIIEIIKSVIRNNYLNVEHIIMDDCSPDQNCCEIIEKWVHENNYTCVFIKNQINQGVTKNLNKVVSIAKGKYLVPGCDIISDDRILKDVEVFEALSEDYAVVFGLTQCIDAEGQLLPIVSPNVPRVNDDNYFNELAHRGNFISGPAATIKIDAIKSIGGYDEELIVDDYDLWMRLSYSGYKFKVRPAILAFYRELKGGLATHPRVTVDILKIKSKFPDKIPLKSVFDQEIQKLLKKHDNEKVQTVISLYKSVFPSSIFVRLLELSYFSCFRESLISLKFSVGKALIGIKSYTHSRRTNS